MPFTIRRPVALRDSPVGYAEAFHALAVARNSATAVEEFSPHQDLVTVLGRRGRAWAERALAGLLDFEPARPQDPDAVELLHTLRSWLNFGTGATRELTVHRNTLAARLRSIEGLLECDLREIGAQSRLHLALALLGPPTRSRSADDGPDLEELLAGEDVNGGEGVKDPACLAMTTESLTREFPLYTPSLLNLVKTSETHVKGLTHED